MNKEAFNKLDIMDQIEFINTELKNNKSITAVSKELNIGRSTISDRFKKVNYTYCKGLKIYVNNGSVTPVIKENNTKITDVIKENNGSITPVKVDTVEEIIKSSEEIKENLLDLVSNYDILKDIIKLHKEKSAIIKQQIILNIEEAESKVITIRVNSKEIEEFNKFCDENKQYKKVDLFSQALKDFREKHQ